MGKLMGCATAVVLVCGVTVAEASLLDRGNGLIYDDVLDITWLGDARLAASVDFGIEDIEADGNGNPGAMTWDTAFEWIDAMNAAGYKGFSNWRMPTMTPVNGSAFDYEVSYDGSTDRGFNNTSITNELSHLYYVGLGDLGLCTTDNPVGSSSDSCNQNAPFTWGLQNTGPFDNLVAGRYWTSVHDTRPGQQRAFDLDATFGQMGTGGTDGPKFVWAVLDGDVAAVPVPAAAWLLGSGLVALWGVGRSRRHTS